MKILYSALTVFLILSIPRQVYSEEENRACPTSGSISVSPASATCPYAKKKYTVDMDGAVTGSWNKKEPEKAKQDPESKSDQALKNELKAKNLSANQFERQYEEARIEESKLLRKNMERRIKLKNAEDWCRKHCNFVLKIRDKIVEGIDNIKRYAGKKYILINGEEYIDKDGEFVKRKEAVRDR